MTDDEQLKQVLREVASAPPPAAGFPLVTQIRAAWRRALLVTLVVAATAVIAVLFVS
ncbi:hypothetical protein OHA72_36110 [Dactylosporangium sp. NBC_01737]|uniref:hypothetical protein n=1 Tax=Dactylosporangium sp. NBC_01737 TaxID=2975959 RepID=UPI002E1095F2|nr:hypothetical protein OHA72_36110 [Dactylosporangium sp. NBC_01737]